MNAPDPSVREQMRALYDLYFQSTDYQRRYPRPNPGTLGFLWRHGLARARCVDRGETRPRPPADSFR